MEQLPLFQPEELDELQGPLRGKPLHECATPDVPGSGPPGQKCGTCMHAQRFRGSSKQWYRCRRFLGRRDGQRTDIKMRWPACSRWRPKREMYTLIPPNYPMPTNDEEMAVMMDYAAETQSDGWELLSDLRHTNISYSDFYPF